MSLDVKSYRPPVETTFTFPESMAESTGYRSVTIRELTGSAESKAINRAGQDGGRLVNELVRESIVSGVQIDGAVQLVSTGDETIDVFMSAIGPKGRALVMAAYHQVNQPAKGEADGFLSSAKTTVR